MAAAHNLDVNAYSLRELLALFDISSYTPSLDEMRKAKKKMLMTHPDQSRLPSTYYIFYRQAYEVILTFYQEQTRQRQSTEHVGDYVAPTSLDGVQSTLDKMSARDFHGKFNQLFEQMDMVGKPDPAKNAWFTRSEPVVADVPDRVNPKDMAHAFQQVKAKTISTVAQYRGVQAVKASEGAASFYDDEANGEYISSDVFSKLKFDDLRKVHKDETVMAVSEADFDRMPKYRSVEHYARERDQAPVEPMAEHDAQQVLQERLRIEREQIMHRAYLSMQKDRTNEKKTQSFLAQFLRLT
jgi:hypothetical protein